MTQGHLSQSGAHRLDVRSADGTTLAVWVDGTGPVLVLVHGSMNDHSTFDPLIDALRDDVTTYAMDRRGFGASGDGSHYLIEREFEDVAAVVDAVAECTGTPVALWGHSYGASCALGGAALTDNIHHIILYEPSLGLRYPAGSIDAVEQAVAAGDHETALLAVYLGVLEMANEDVAAMRSSPQWPTRLATAPTVARECRAEEGWQYHPGQFDRIAAPTLLLTGTDSPPALAATTRAAAAALPSARTRVLHGHGHMAHKTDPAMVAAIVREFISS